MYTTRALGGSPSSRVITVAKDRNYAQTIAENPYGGVCARAGRFFGRTSTRADVRGQRKAPDIHLRGRLEHTARAVGGHGEEYDRRPGNAAKGSVQRNHCGLWRRRGPGSPGRWRNARQLVVGHVHGWSAQRSGSVL